MHIDDKQLIFLCKKNDRKAQNFLFEKYKKKVLFICMRYTSTAEEAKDLLQETFIKIFKTMVTIGGDKEIESLPAWIHKIATHTSIDDFRKKKGQLFMEDVNDHFLSSSESTPIENMSAQELLDIIQKMPNGYQIIFNLYIIEGYNHGEISSILNISKATSRSQLTRAKSWLKQRLLIDNYGNYERTFG